MNKNIRKIGLAIMWLTMFFSTSCTKYLDNINVDKKAITEEDLEQDFSQIKSYFPGMMNSIAKIDPAWQYQVQQNLNADIFSGYMMTPTPFASNKNNITYDMQDGWNGFAISTPVNGVLNPWLKVKSLAEEDYKDWYSISMILKVFAGHRLVDIFGPFPYTKFGDPAAKFDSEKEAYEAFFTDLDFAITTLKKYKGSETETAFASVDISTLSGSYERWIQLANTLRLRLAMRVSGVDNALAEEQAKKSLNEEDGFLDIDFAITHVLTNPLNTLSKSWGDILMSAPMESIMGGYEDPRMEKYFDAIEKEDSPLDGEIRGIRQGINLTEKAEYGYFSKLNIAPDAPMQLMTVAEAYFLQAEAALYGWGGDAKSLYETGIQKSFIQHGAEIGDYLSNTKKPSAYVDPIAMKKDTIDGKEIEVKSDVNDVPQNEVSQITVNWDDATTDEEKLEKIITQKWIAMFPEGQEAWSEQRRTGYPILFPVVKNNSTDIADGEFISRLPYPVDFKAINPTAVQNAISTYLGGKDSPATKLWWAKE